MKPSFKNLLREKEFWLLVFFVLLYCLRLILFGESFFFRDLYLYFLPQKRLFAEFFAQGTWPLWDRYLHGGQPYIGAMGDATFYPFNLLYLVFPLLTAFNAIIIVHLLLAAIFAYAFARVIGLLPLSALIVGIAYAFCGVTLSEINLLNTFLSASYLPLLLLCWHLFLQGQQWRWFALAVFVAVMRLFLGASEQYVIGMVLLFGWTLCLPNLQIRWRSRLLSFVLLNVFAFGIAAVQLFPTLEMLSQSSRGGGHNFYAFSYWSLSPLRLPEMIFPHFCGYFDRLAASDYWGRNIDNDAPTTLIVSIYWGVPLLFFAISAGIGRGEAWPLSTRLRRFLLIMMFASILFALGRFLPFFEVLYLYVPVLRIFRFPVKLLMAGVLPVALLAGCAAERFFSARRDGDCSAVMYGWQPSSAFLAGLWLAGGLCVFSLALLTTSHNFSVAFHQFFFKQNGNDISQQGLTSSFFHTFGSWFLLTLLFQYRRYRVTSLQSLLAAVIIFADVFIAGIPVNPTAPREFYTDIPAVVNTIRGHLQNGRLYRALIPRNPILQVPANEILWGNRWNLEILADYSASFYGIPVIFHEDFDKLANVRVMQFKDILERAAWPQKLPLLSAAGVTVILTDERVFAEGAQFITDVPNASNLTFHLYKNPQALEPVQMLTSWEFADSDAEAEKAMLRPDYDPRRHVVLQTDAELSLFARWFSPPTLGSIPSIPAAGCQPAALTDIQNASTAISVSVRSKCGGVLVFPSPFYSEWRGEVDGFSVPIQRANLAFSAMFVPAGEHRIRFHYVPISLIAGGIVSFSSLLCLIGVMRIMPRYYRPVIL
ncbi:hypothetical membrane protein [Candidatus Moduliflexus flocculans]|uniref:Hypothetical membrane protein n=1 Tax=Candidatus Moduliflexus flocculans TaxID=1499966 RepID=A0A081BLZ3_9BACT|nr:hypothetical membrane protein [Candidatus Moduliflexus flocculans]